MRFFLYNLEELYPRGRNGDIGRIVAAFTDTKALSIDSLYRNRSGASAFECEILKDPPGSNQKKPGK